jgi:predicted RNA-binding Zn-ribbon protein involved in translation (DUF1610 family)
MIVADTLRRAEHAPARSDLTHGVCPDCADREPVPLLALCGADLSDDVRTDGPLTCDECARIIAGGHAGDIVHCPGCGAHWVRR